MTIPARKRARRTRRGLRLVALITSLAILVLTAFAAGVDSLISRIDSGSGITSNEGSQSGQTDDSGVPKPINILIMGSDTREGQGDGYGTLAAYGGSQRSDTTVLVHISADRSRALAVSIPRDSWVQIPACTNAEGESIAPRVDRFNIAFALGGADCTIATVESLTQVPIDHWATVDFNGFKQVVDALGGVEVCLDRAVKDRKSKLDLPAGRTNVNGEQALSFVRARFNIGDGGDLSRMRRQQAFMASVVRKASSTQLLLNPIQLLKVITAITSTIETDSGLASSDRLSQIALDLSGIPTEEVRFVTVPSRIRPDGSTLEWTTRARRLWQAVRNDKPWPPSSAPDLAAELAEEAAQVALDPDVLTVAPSEIKVRVLNGAGVSGIARRTGDALRALDYQVVGVGDAEVRVSDSQIEHGPKKLAEARTLAAAMGDLKLIEVPGLGDSLVLTIGSDKPSPRKVETLPAPPEPAEDPDATGVSDATEVFCAS